MTIKSFQLLYIKHISIALLLLPFCGWSQRILADEHDAVSKQRKFELYPLTLVSFSKIKMDISFGAAGTATYVRLSGSGIGTEIVNVDDKLIFRLENGSTVTVQSNELQTYEVVGTTSTYKHSYDISLADLAKLGRYNLKSLRKYHAEEFDDITIPAQNGRQVKNLCRFLIEELKKEHEIRGDTIFVAQEKKEPVRPAETKPEEPIVPLITRQPAFPGGENVWSNFLKRNLQPPAELKLGEKKVVSVQFLVHADGAVSELQIVQSAGPSFDKEVLRVLKRMPYWKPALEKGRPVDAVVTQSITLFKEDSSASL